MGYSAALPPTQANVLLSGALRGDKRAERELLTRVLLPVLDVAVSRALLGARARRFEKSDVIQEVFQHLYQDDWRRLRSFDPERGSLASYVWAIADKWLYDHGRRLAPPQPIDDIDTARSPDSGPERRAALGQILDRLHAALTVEEMALFQWIHVEGASHGEVAARIGVALEATHKRAQRLEDKIRRIISGDELRRDEKEGGTT